MLSKCANPVCTAQLRYLHKGRIFNVATVPGSSSEGGRVTSKIEHFWLCEDCARVMKVVRENGVVVTRPLHLMLPAPRITKKIDAA